MTKIELQKENRALKNVINELADLCISNRGCDGSNYNNESFHLHSENRGDALPSNKEWNLWDKARRLIGEKIKQKRPRKKSETRVAGLARQFPNGW